jgi:hypothetical protein
MKSSLLSVIKKLVNGGKSGTCLATDSLIAPVEEIAAHVAIAGTAITGASMAREVKEPFDKLARRIAKNEAYSTEELLPFLCLESLHDRIYVNYQLGCVFHYAGNLSQARVFIERAWNLSEFDVSILESFKTIQLAIHNTDAVREAHKRLGLSAAAKGDLSVAIEHFDQAHFAFGFYDHVDKWQYDYDIMNALDSNAERYRVKPVLESGKSKIRVGYLLRGLLEVNSILIRHVLSIVQHHDRSAFEIFCFAPESQNAIDNSAQGPSVIAAFRAAGCEVIAGPDSVSERSQALLGVARKIHDANLDILVTCAGLVDYSQYFLCSLRPAPIMVGLVQGPPAQFAPPILDWCISWSKHPLMDTPVNCSHIPWRGSESIVSVSVLTRKSLGLPDDACVILSGGRLEKFQNKAHWNTVKQVLERYSDVHYVASGPLASDVSFLGELFDGAIMSRIHCLGWRNDFSALVSLADIVLDTYPNGGGQSLVESMSAGIPIVAHRNNFMKLFDQTDWSPVEDFIDDDQLLVERGDFNRLQEILSLLIEDPVLRKSLGKRCQENLALSNTDQAVTACENLYRELVKNY